MTDRPWLAAYPQGVPADIDPTQYASLVALMDEAFRQYADRVAYSFMGKDISFAQTDALSRAFAAYLQGQGLVKGDRVAIMITASESNDSGWTANSAESLTLSTSLTSMRPPEDSPFNACS